MTEIKLTIPGEPVAKGRPRVTKSGIAYTPAKTAGYENLVKMCYMEQAGGVRLEGQIVCYMTAWFQIPASASKREKALMLEGTVRPTCRKDIDNIVKSVLDSLNGLAYYDDKQVVELHAHKKYSATPCVELKLAQII